jgi:hypothetical protein
MGVLVVGCGSHQGAYAAEEGVKARVKDRGFINNNMGDNSADPQLKQGDHQMSQMSKKQNQNALKHGGRHRCRQPRYWLWRVGPPGD